MDVSTFKAVAGAAVFFGGIGIYLYRTCFKPEEKPEEPQYMPFESYVKSKPKPTEKPIQIHVEKPAKPAKSKRAAISPETIEAMHKQADAERAIAEALEHKAQYITDPVKRARIEKQAALSWTRFNKILDSIDKLTASD